MATDIASFDQNAAANPDNGIFGLPFTEEESMLILLPVPWEVTVSYGAGTSRAADHMLRASYQIDLFDADYPDAWRKGIYMRKPDKKLLLKSDYLRKEAELLIDYTIRGQEAAANKFMSKSLRDINEGSTFLNEWVYDQCSDLLQKGKLIGLIGGDHSTPLGYWKALAEKHGDFGILQIDAHCDLREAYEGFTYSHASVAYNALKEIPQLLRLVQLGVRDFSAGEWELICNSNYRVVTYFDKDVKTRLYEGQSWKDICDEVISKLPELVHLSFDIDGLDPKLCPNSGTPVQGGFETDQINYLLRRLIATGRKLIGFDLVEVGVGETDWDSNVGARELWYLSNLLLASNS